MSSVADHGDSSSPRGCRDCGGTGYVRMAPTEDYEECVVCDGTGDRFGAGRTKEAPVPDGDSSAAKGDTSPHDDRQAAREAEQVLRRAGSQGRKPERSQEVAAEVTNGDSRTPVSRQAEALAEFHAHPNAILDDRTNGIPLRRVLLAEEYAELVEAMEEDDLRHVAREMADVLYVLYGTALVYGIDLDAAFEEIHRAAMSKMDAGLRREDGKIIKPPGFVPPDMTEAVRHVEQ